MKRVIVEGVFVNSDRTFKGQIEIINGVIRNIGKNLGNADFSFDDNHLIFPGFGDVHIHAREDQTEIQNYKEDYDTVCKAAINGGVVHISAMPNTPQPLTSDKFLQWHRKRVSDMPITVINYAGIGPGTLPLETNVPYKAYTGPSVGPLFFKNEEQLRQTLIHYKKKPISFHVEDYDLLEESKNNDTHDKRRPVECVLKALSYVLDLIEEFDIDAKLCHWNCADESFEMIKMHRSKGYKTKVEVSPLHLFFDTDLLEAKPELWPYLQMNPALQSKSHRLQLIEALREGFIDLVATDHAPHQLDEKFKNFGSEEEYKKLRDTNLDECIALSKKDGTSGTPQLDTFSLIMTWLIKEHNFTPEDIARIASENPGKFVNQFQDDKFGRIEEGYTGSLTVLNTNKPTELTRDYIKSKARWSPFENITFPGSVAMTMHKGVVVHDQN